MSKDPDKDWPEVDQTPLYVDPPYVAEEAYEDQESSSESRSDRSSKHDSEEVDSGGREA
jgi:hypothetical protein